MQINHNTMKITITKKQTETTYEKVVRIHTFEVNGKPVNVEEYKLDDPEMGNYDAGAEIVDDEDSKKLTEEEYEALGENLNELMDLADDTSDVIEFDE